VQARFVGDHRTYHVVDQRNQQEFKNNQTAGLLLFFTDLVFFIKSATLLQHVHQSLSKNMGACQFYPKTDVGMEANKTSDRE